MLLTLCFIASILTVLLPLYLPGLTLAASADGLYLVLFSVVLVTNVVTSINGICSWFVGLFPMLGVMFTLWSALNASYISLGGIRYSYFAMLTGEVFWVFKMLIGALEMLSNCIRVLSLTLRLMSNYVATHLLASIILAILTLSTLHSTGVLVGLWVIYLYVVLDSVIMYLHSLLYLVLVHSYWSEIHN